MSFIKENYFYTQELAKTDVPTKIIVGSKTGKFVPNINFSKWDDEAWLNINFPAVVTTQQPTISTDVISQTIGDYTFKWYTKDDSILEHEIILGKKPPINTLTLNIDFPNGLEFFYQPALTIEEAKTAIRPDNVVGSYAVYWNKTNDEYKTGKFCHIYAWEATDALGIKEKLTLNIDPIAKKMTLTIRQQYLNTATYPVKLMGMGDTFGQTSRGGSSDGTENIDRACSKASAPTGITSKIHGWIGTFEANHNIKLGLYDDNSGTPNNRLATAVVINLPANKWPTEDLSADYVASLTGGTLWFCKNSDNANVMISYDAQGGSPYKTAYRSYANAMPATFGTPDATHDRLLSMYVDWAAAGNTYTVSCSSTLSIASSDGEIGNFPEIIAAELSFAGANSEIGNFPENIDVGLSLATSNSEIANFPESASIGLGLSSTSSEVADFMRQVQVSMGLSGGDAEKGEYPEISSITILLEGTVTGTTAIIHISSAQFNVVSTVSEIAEFVKSINVNFGVSAIASEIANFVSSINAGISVAVNVSEKADFIKGISTAFNLSPTVSKVYVPVGAGEYSKSVSVQILISALVSCSLAISGILRFIAKDINFRTKAEDISFYILTKK
jgi:hypothetical protein